MRACGGVRKGGGWGAEGGCLQVANGGRVVGVIGDHESAATVLRADHRVCRVCKVGGQADLAEVVPVARDVEGEGIAAFRRGINVAAPHIDVADVRVHEEELQRSGA